MNLKIGITFLCDYVSRKLVVSKEHIEGKWITEDEIDNYNYIWPAMRRMIKKGFWYYGLLN